MNKKTVSLILKAVSLGMGVAVIVLGILQVLSAETAVTMLGLGLTALSLETLQKAE